MIWDDEKVSFFKSHSSTVKMRAVGAVRLRQHVIVFVFPVQHP